MSYIVSWMTLSSTFMGLSQSNIVVVLGEMQMRMY